MALNLCVTYDFISTNKRRGLVNQSKKLDIFRLILKKIDCQVYSEVPCFSQKEFCMIHQIDLDNSRNYYDIKLSHLGESALNYLKECFKDIDYFIGYELSKNTKDILNYLDVQYIDIWLSSVRFHKDILLDFNSNNKNIMKTLSHYALKEKKLYKRAQTLAQHSTNFFKQPDIEDNSCLIIGQVLQDKSVLKDNKFLTLLDYIEEIKTLSLKYTCLYLLKHPLMTQDDFKNIEEKLLEIQNLHILTGINTYHLLTLKQIKCVAGISSSVLTEAKYFKKKVVFFFKPVIDNSSCRIYKSYYKSSFWEKILGIKHTKKFKYSVDDNYLRLKYHLYYAYDIFLPTTQLDLKDKYNTMIAIYNFISNLDVSQQYILYGFGSVGKLIYPHLKSNIVAIIDKVLFEKTNEYEGTPIIAISDIENYSNVNIIISPFLHQNDILLELRHCSNKLIQIRL